MDNMALDECVHVYKYVYVYVPTFFDSALALSRWMMDGVLECE